MPETPELANFLRDAERHRGRIGHRSWQSVTPRTPSPGEGPAPTAITVGIQVKGTYEQVIDYLTRMASLIDDCSSIDNVQFTAAVSGASAGATRPDRGASTGTVQRWRRYSR